MTFFRLFARVCVTAHRFPSGSSSSSSSSSHTRKRMSKRVAKLDNDAEEDENEDDDHPEGFKTASADVMSKRV